MSKNGWAAIATLSAAALGSFAFAQDPIETRTQTLFVKYSDGTAEHHVVRYQALFSTRRWETGRPSTWKHPVDDRTCNLEIHSAIQRDIGLVDHSGHTSWRNEWRRIYDQPITNRAPGLGIKTGFQGVNCGRAAAEFDQTVDQAKGDLQMSLENIMALDRPALSAELKGDGQIVDVQVE